MNNIFQFYLKEQFINGILDIDALCLLCHVHDLKDCYVAGGYQDCKILLNKLLKSDIRRFTIIVRDYEPHFLTIHVLVDNYKLIVIILDSTPNQPENIIRKWLKLVEQIYNDYDINGFINNDFLQHDDFTCKLFAFNNARRINKRTKEELLNIFSSKDPINILKLHELPYWLVKDIQSTKTIDQYMLEASYEIKQKLESHFTKHFQELVYKDQQKLQNLSIVHFKDKAYQKINKWLESNKAANYTDIFWKYVGLESIENHRKDEYVMIVLQLSNEIMASQEQVFDENKVSIIFKKPREDKHMAIKDWYNEYKPYLIKMYENLLDTWLPLDRFIIDHDQDFVIVHGLKNDLNMLINDIYANPCQCLNKGMYQPLATIYGLSC